VRYCYFGTVHMRSNEPLFIFVQHDFYLWLTIKNLFIPFK